MSKTKTTIAVAPAAKRELNDEWASTHHNYKGWPVFETQSQNHKVILVRPEDDVILVTLDNPQPVLIPFKAMRAMAHWVLAVTEEQDEWRPSMPEDETDNHIEPQQEVQQ